MEVERALFRIYQRILSSDTGRETRLSAERWLPRLTACLVACLAVVHTSYVGQATCLPGALKQAGLWNATAGKPALPEDVLLQLTVTEGEELVDTGISLQMPEPTAEPLASEPLGTGARGGDGISVASESIDILGESTTPPARRRRDIAPDPAGILLSYRFALDREVISMRQKVFESHNFEVRNISISERCLVPSRILGEVFEFFGSLDNLVINELAYTLRSRGFLQRMQGREEVESWAWSAEQVESASPEEGRPLFAAAARKLQLLLKSMATYVLISSITGFFIRVAVNGSAVLMFPIAMAMQALGSGSSRISMNVLVRSFPWIGVHVEVLRRAGRSPWPLFRSQLAFLLFQSFAYLACNLAWRFIIYRKSAPEGFEEKVFSFCSVLELFNLIFVRSVASSAVFPKLAFSTMVYLHFYLFSSLYPFHTLALASAASLCAYLMVYCLNNFEEPALRSDPFSHTTPTAAHPRALYMPQLSPSWALESAPLWSMFYMPEPPSEFSAEAMRNITDEEYFMP